jgi:hypothetical protein
MCLTSELFGPTLAVGFIGPQGPAGPQGNPGATATVTVGFTTTGAPGTSATITNSGTSSAAVLNFTIPQGAAGSNTLPAVLPAGSPSAHSISFVGSPMAGMFSSNANTINFSTNGTTQLTIRPDGDVDIPGSIRKLGQIFLNNLGAGNTSLGINALAASSASNNTAIGNLALSFNTFGSDNTASGFRALQENTTGSDNTATGNYALITNTGSFNTATGSICMQSNTSGMDNTADGYGALQTVSTGSSNTAVGFIALQMATGSSNVAIGASAGQNVSAGSNNIHISNQGISSDNAVVKIGTQGVQTSTFLAGISGVNISGVPVLVSSSGQLGVASSSRRFKQDIADMGDATANLMRLRPVTYRYKQPFEDGSQPLQYGLIAEEVVQVYPELVAHSADGKIETVKYQLLDSMLLNEMQKQHATITAQENTITAQQEKIHPLEERLSRLELLLEQSATK